MNETEEKVEVPEEVVKEEISPETIKELKEESKKPQTLLELIKDIMKKQDEKKKQILYDEILPGK